MNVLAHDQKVAFSRNFSSKWEFLFLINMCKVLSVYSPCLESVRFFLRCDVFALLREIPVKITLIGGLLV